MFNLQGSELVIILLLALVVLGPEKLPDAMRKAGQFYAELKKMSSGFQTEFRAAVEEPLQELRDTANTIRDSADFTKLQNGERDEKPKSADMVAAADPSAVPSDDLPFGPADDGAADDGAADDGAPDDGEDGGPVNDPVIDDPRNQVPFSSVVISNPTPQRKHVAFTQESSAAPEAGAPVDESPVIADRLDSSDRPGVPAASMSSSDRDATESDSGDRPGVPAASMSSSDRDATESDSGDRPGVPAASMSSSDRDATESDSGDRPGVPAASMSSSGGDATESDSGDRPGVPAASMSSSGGDATQTDPGDAGADTPAEGAAAEQPE